MGKIPSATTLSSIAYLTESGRRYLYGKDENGNQIRFNPDGSDNFSIKDFALFDNDRNYKTVKNFKTGEMPDIAGSSDNTCLKTASDVMRKSAIVFQGQITNSAPSTVSYYSTNPVISVNINNL